MELAARLAAKHAAAAEARAVLLAEERRVQFEQARRAAGSAQVEELKFRCGEAPGNVGRAGGGWLPRGRVLRR